MSAAQENSKKNLIVYSVFGVLLAVFGVYAYNAFFAGGPAPAAPAAPVVVQAPAAAKSTTMVQPAAGGTGLGAAPGIAATKMASTSSSLDPTLDETAMLRTERLVYAGTGRNIFSLIYVPPPPPITEKAPPPRPIATVAAPTGPPPPPPPPPINLKFFGVAVRANGAQQAFLLSGEDVYLASQNDIVARKYKIVTINATSIQVEDLTNHNTQTLPLLKN
jgi:hypothetical protein